MVIPTGVERVMRDGDIIVSKTDLKGRITYANDIFCELADYSVADVMDEPHSLVRNPTMPRCVFKLLWDTIQKGEEIFAYVNNCAKNGDHYWVFAHVTPSYDGAGKIVGYHSNRRKPSKQALSVIAPLYKTLLDEENKHSNRKDGMMAGYNLLLSILEEKGVSYDALILSL
jgi:PAS domain S-box-containing protein